MSEIAKWYSNKNLFVTGATGFVGKCLVEKLLRDCPDIGNIYIIIRSKKGVSFEQRKSEYKNHVVFSTVKNANPRTLDKLQIVEGDICEPNLGMSSVDRNMIAETVSIIFHSAADVRFDRRLIDAYNTNVRGGKAVLEFATEFKHLLAFVLVSTAYSQPNEIGKLEERHYDSIIRPELLHTYIENIDEDILDALTPKILCQHPNTYSFTKSIVEQLVYDYREKFPTAIARPPIIATAWKEPLPGYTEGIHGVNGWSLATGRGVLRSMICTDTHPCNIMPADIVANGLIVLGYERGKRFEKQINVRNKNKDNSDTNTNNSLQLSDECEEPLYFNITEEKPVSWRTYIDIVTPNYFKHPFNLALWYPGGSFKQNRLYHFICVILFQVLPAIFVDMLLILFRHPPVLLRVQRIISISCFQLEYYLTNVFIFKADNYNESLSRLNTIDRRMFYDRSTLNYDEYFCTAAYGSKVYLAKEKPETSLKARKLYQRLWFLDISTKMLLTYWFLLKCLSYFNITIH